MLAENLPILKIVEKIAEKLGAEEIASMKYCTLTHRF